MHKRSFFIILFLIVLISVNSQAWDNFSILGRETSAATPIFHLTSGLPGPTVLVIGGTHGDEKAGWLAALRLLSYYPNKGRIIVVPFANIRAVQLGVRTVPGEGDLNRSYPGNNDGSAMEKQAQRIFELIQSLQPDLVLDLHESQGFYKEDGQYLGQTIIAYPNEDIVLDLLEILTRLNSSIEVELEKFNLLIPPIIGSTAWAVGTYLGIDAFTTETCKQLHLSVRVDYQLALIGLMLELLGVELRCDHFS